jgi:ferrous iron transport protein B
MSSCCEPETDSSSGAGTLTVALAGNPNSGKTTIFNALTGLRQKVANYPGVTVEKKTGRCKLADGKRIDVIDVPGTYSLVSRSPDEQVANQVLRGLRADVPLPNVVIVVVDASNLQRNLYLVSQLMELGRPLVIALNMMDIAERRGLIVSPEKLQQALGVPVVPVVGYKKKGIEELKSAIKRAVIAPLPNWPLPDAMREEISTVGGALAILDASTAVEPTGHPRLDYYRNCAERLLIGDRAEDMHELANREPVASLLNSASDRLKLLGIDPMQADVEAHYRWIENVASSVVTTAPTPSTAESRTLGYAAPQPRTLTEKVDAVLIHRVWGLIVFALVMTALFVSIFWLAQPLMNGIQAAINWLAELATSHIGPGPLHDLLKDGIFGGVGTVVVFVPQIALLFFFLAILEDSGYLARAAFLMDRLLSKVGLHGKSFIPLLSSFACAIPGIMAARTIESRKDRLATIFVAPFMSCSARLPVYTLLIGTVFASFGPLRQAGVMLACYVLGILAAVGTAYVFRRSLLKGGTTSFILELPSYKVPQAMEVARQVWKNSAQFLTKAGTTILAISILLWAVGYYPRLPGLSDGSRANKRMIGDILKLKGAIAASSVDRASKIPGSDFLELPAQSERAAARDAQIVADASLTDQQKIDQLLAAPPLAWESVLAAKHVSVIKGTRQIFFGDPPKDPQSVNVETLQSKDGLTQTAANEVAAEQSEHSIAGRLGHAMEPMIKPLGFDWKMGVGLVSAFAARETFVSSMGITYATGAAEEGKTNDLSEAMKKDQYANGQPVWTPLVAVSLLAWFVLAMQCMSTFAIVRRETNGWKWPIFMLVYMNALAYVVSLAIYQIGSHFHA